MRTPYSSVAIIYALTLTFYGYLSIHYRALLKSSILTYADVLRTLTTYDDVRLSMAGSKLGNLGENGEQ